MLVTSRGVVLGDGYDVIALYEGVLGPGEHQPVDELLAVGRAAGHGCGAPANGRPRHPGDYGVVALAQVGHVAADSGDDAHALMPEDHGAVLPGVVHLVYLGVADAAGEELDRRLVRLRVRDFQLVDEEGLIDADPGWLPCFSLLLLASLVGEGAKRRGPTRGILRGDREPVNICGKRLEQREAPLTRGLPVVGAGPLRVYAPDVSAVALLVLNPPQPCLRPKPPRLWPPRPKPPLKSTSGLDSSHST